MQVFFQLLVRHNLGVPREISLALYPELRQRTRNAIGVHTANGVLVIKEDAVFIADSRWEMMRVKLNRRMIARIRVDDRNLLTVRKDLVSPGVHVGTRAPVGLQQDLLIMLVQMNLPGK